MAENSRIDELIAENARLREALTASCGYMRNASIGLDVGATKRVTRELLEEGYKRVSAALSHPANGLPQRG